MQLIENAELFVPEPLGRKSLLLAGGTVEAVGADGAALARAGVELETIDGTGCFVIPGLVDAHVHLIGGSGEKGFQSQTPEISAEALLRGGTTTVVGTLGTDTTTRTMPALLGKVKALRALGFSAYAWTGGYDARPLTSSIRDDIVLVEEIIGAGEFAIADERAAQLSAKKLARLAANCYVAGMLSGKAGLLHLHVGPSESRLAIVREVLERFDVRPATFYPTHVERSEKLMCEAIELTRRGVPIDLDVVEHDLPRWLRFYRHQGGDPSMITASSDAPIGPPEALFAQVMQCVREGVAPLEEALALVTSNPARILRLVGRRGPVLLVDRQSLELRQVVR